MRYVALLRGINVGRNKRVAMSALRELLGALGHTDVTTYLQSGNALFTSPRDDPAGLAREIERRVARDLGLEVAVMVRTGEELARVVAGNPFPSATVDPARLQLPLGHAGAGAAVGDRPATVRARQVRGGRSGYLPLVPQRVSGNQAHRRLLAPRRPWRAGHRAQLEHRHQAPQPGRRP